ncbi:MAG: hypothetical protein ACFFBC_06055 [Promethearchaeota archaeon]
MSRLKLKCSKCGNIMETLPSSSQDIIIDEESGEILYWNGEKRGYRPADYLVCEKCQENAY